MKHAFIGVLFWLAAALAALALVGGCFFVGEWIVTALTERADWPRVRRIITWAVWIWLLLSIARFFNAKARRP